MPKISNIVKKFAKNDFVYWETTVPGTYGRAATFKDPIQAKCRWEEKVSQVVTDDGRTVVNSVYLLLTRKLVPGSLIMKGTIDQWKALPGYPDRPTPDQGGFEVLACRPTEDFKGTDVIYEAYA